MTDMTEGGTMNGLEWARKHGEHFRFRASLDNYEPPRNWCYGNIYRYMVDTSDAPRFVVDNLHPAHNGVRGPIMFDFERCSFLIDDGHIVEACYVSGWNHGGAYFMLQTFPTNFDRAGNPIMRGDHPQRQVEFFNWALGPRKTYHLKLEKRSDPNADAT